MTISDEELEASVSELLLGELKSSYVRGGSLDVSASHDHLMGFVSSVFLLEPDAYWYLLWLAKNRVRGLVQEQLDRTTRVLDAAQYAGRPYRNIRSVADLISSTAALQEISTGLISRRVRNGTSSPLQRFDAAITRFLSQYISPNIVTRAGDVVSTAAETADSVALEWADLVETHSEILVRTQALVDAYSAVSSLAMPAHLAQVVVTRVQDKIAELSTVLTTSEQAKHNRRAFIDLHAAKSILTRIATYTPPSEVRASFAATPAAGTAAEIQIVGGPWSVGPGQTLELIINGTPYSVPLPTSRPVFVSEASDPTTLLVGSIIGASLDHGASSLAYTYAAPDLVDPASFVAATNAAIAGVTAYVEGGVFCFRRESDDPTASLSFLADVPALGDFVTWLLDESSPVRGATPIVYPTPVRAEALSEAINTSALGVVAEASSSSVVSFQATPLLGTVMAQMESTGSLTSTGATTVTATSGYRQIYTGRALLVGGVSYTVTNVVDQQITTSPSIPAGTWTYLSGPDLSQIVEIGDKVVVVGDRGVSVWTSIVSVLGPSVTLGGAVWAWGPTPRLTVVRETVRVSNRSLAPGNSIQVLGSSGAMSLGVAVGTTTGTLSEFSTTTDLPTKGITVGDPVVLVNGTSYVSTVRAVAANSLTVDPVAYVAGTWQATVSNQGYVQAATLSTGLNVFGEAPQYADLEKLMPALLSGGKLTATISAAITAYATTLQTLLTALDQYSVGKAAAIDQVLRLLEERGLDRGVDVYLAPDVAQLLEATPEDLVYSSWFARHLSDATRLLAPVTKTSSALYGYQEFRLRSFQQVPYDPTR